jgi:hypothetical protein
MSLRDSNDWLSAKECSQKLIKNASLATSTFAGFAKPIKNDGELSEALEFSEEGGGPTIFVVPDTFFNDFWGLEC